MNTIRHGEIAIRNFQAGAGSDDRIDLRDVLGLSFGSLMAEAEMVGGNTVLDVGNGAQVTLLGVHVSALHADDFLLAPAPAAM